MLTANRILRRLELRFLMSNGMLRVSSMEHISGIAAETTNQPVIYTNWLYQMYLVSQYHGTINLEIEYQTKYLAAFLEESSTSTVQIDGEIKYLFRVAPGQPDFQRKQKHPHCV